MAYADSWTKLIAAGPLPNSDLPFVMRLFCYAADAGTNESLDAIARKLRAMAASGDRGADQCLATVVSL